MGTVEVNDELRDRETKETHPFLPKKRPNISNGLQVVLPLDVCSRELKEFNLSTANLNCLSHYLIDGLPSKFKDCSHQFRYSTMRSGDAL